MQWTTSKDKSRKSCKDILIEYHIFFSFFGLPMLRLGKEFGVYGSVEDVEENKIYHAMNMNAGSEACQITK